MIGLSLAGGGVRGAYQVGAYLALKKCHIKFDGYVGTSIGSFNAAMLAAGKYKELLNFWQNIDVPKIVGFNKEYVKRLRESKRDDNVLIHLFNNMKKIVKDKGFKVDGLFDVLSEENLEDTVREAGKDYGLVTVRARDLKPLYKFIQDIPKGKLNEYIIASCYLPLFKREKLIDDSYYLDGGFYDNSPANMLLDKGYEKVYVVELSSVGIKRKIKDKNRVVVIKPSHNLKSILNTNLEEINYNIKLGYYDTLKVVKKLDGYKYIFKIYKEGVYNYLWEKVGTKTRKEMEIFFKTTNPKKIIIKALEFVMINKKYEYTKVYNPLLVIREIKKMKRKIGVYRFINML